MNPSFKLSWEPLIFQQNIYRRKIPQQCYRMHFFSSSQCFWMALTLQNLKLGGNLEFSWYSCNILRYCSNRCIVWFFIPENCPAQANRKFPVQLYVKIQIIFEPPFWICKWANHLWFLAMKKLYPLIDDQYTVRPYEAFRFAVQWFIHWKRMIRSGL